jgi:hypothetical protein
MTKSIFTLTLLVSFFTFNLLITSAQAKRLPPEDSDAIGFKSSTAICYDGTFIELDYNRCYSSELHFRKAQEACENHCYEDGSKCGVNSWSADVNTKCKLKRR